MIILRAIGNFFVKIGRWIKNTAWVQPLLIVGGIFGIIFSIPYISSWVSSWFVGGNEANNYYAKFKVSLEGADNKNSDANKLFTYMSDITEEGKQKYGEKFFVVFVQEDCTGCEEIYKGFEYLQNNWNSGEFAAPEGVTAKDFRMYSIFVDSEATINNETKNYFKDYFFNSFDIMFEDVKSDIQDGFYAQNKGDSYIKELDSLDNVDSFATPTVFLFDPANQNANNQLAVSEVLFTVPGKGDKSGPVNIARTLYDCWYSLDVFGSVIA